MTEPTGGRPWTIEDILVTTELDLRPSRAPDHAAEAAALGELAQVMAESPRTVLARLAEAALVLCRADSAGVSIAERDGDADVFRWHATAGMYGPHLGSTMPYAFSPCGTVLARGATQLMADPARYFPYIDELGAPIVEVLLVPFHRGGVAIGTVWIISHTQGKWFDAEDARLVTGLSRFAGAASGLLARVEAAQHAEAALEDVRHRLTATLAAAEVATWTWDMVTDRVVADINMARLFAVPDDVAAGGRIADYFAAIHPEDRDRVIASVQTAIDRRRPFEAIYRVQNSDGEVRSLIARGWAEYAADGTPIRFPGVVVDISRQLDAEAALRQSESRYRGLFESMDEAFCVIELMFDAAGRPLDYLFLETNPAFTKQCGLVDAVGKTMRQLVPDQEDVWFATYGRVATTGEPIRFEDGSAAMGGLWWNVYAFRLGGPGSRKVGILFSDITARKRIEGELRASEARLRLALDAAELGFWTLDTASGRISADERFHRIFGVTGPITLEQALGLVRPDEHARVQAAIAAAMNPEDPRPYTSEYQVTRPDGEVRWVAVNGRTNYIDGASGRRLVSLDGTVADVTEQKRNHDALRQLAVDLAESGRRKDEFLATLAHELRNPLAPIRNGLTLLRAGGEAAARDRLVAMMERQLGQLVHLVDDLLDVSRVTTGKVTLRTERVAVARVVEAALETSRPLLEQFGHTLSVTSAPEPVWVDADPTRLAQVLTNLLNNAAKYTPRGGRISVSTTLADDEVILRVADDGVGIPADMLPRVFDLFTQVGRSLDRSQGGLGIGLSLVRKLVEMHGGTVTVESPGPGGGSTFSVRLPRSVRPGERAPTAVTGAAQTPGLRILVVDDNVDGAETLAMLLSIYGHDTETAHDGAGALAMATRMRPEVVLLDIGLPDMNGFEVAERLRRSALDPRPMLVALTGWGSDEDRRRAAQAGFDVHLTKPVESSQLTALLARVSQHPRSE